MRMLKATNESLVFEIEFQISNKVTDAMHQMYALCVDERLFEKRYLEDGSFIYVGNTFDEFNKLRQLLMDALIEKRKKQVFG